MKRVFLMIWSAILTSGWWAYGSVISVPVLDWHTGLIILWSIFIIANIATALIIICVIAEFIDTANKNLENKK
ncbi:MAG TPA: hypothetical protein VMV32_08760 [Ignavibacteriaceae bacterium]|nr:hypothetical protein [Ignavibacteriaceae bacterium]